MGINNRKHSHNKNKPAGQRYLAEMRWVKNKKLAIARQAKRVAKKAAKLESRRARLG